MQYNADEVYGMAERIEDNAVEFYTKAANLHANRGDVEFLRRLADMESEHRKTFSAMRRRLTEDQRKQPVEDPYAKATLFLDRLADAHGGEGTLSMAQPLDASDTLETLVRRGLELERKAILFYGALRVMIPADRGRKEIDRIVDEEKKHVVVLAQELARLRAGPGSERPD